MLPKMMSTGIAPPRRLAMIHPTNSPGMAAGVKNGSTVSASENRIWTSPKLSGANTSVRTTYTAAMAAPCTRKWVPFVFHVFYSPLVLFYEWKVTNTRHIYRRWPPCKPLYDLGFLRAFCSGIEYSIRGVEMQGTILNYLITLACVDRPWLWNSFLLRGKPACRNFYSQFFVIILTCSCEDIFTWAFGSKTSCLYGDRGKGLAVTESFRADHRNSGTDFLQYEDLCIPGRLRHLCLWYFLKSLPVSGFYSFWRHWLQWLWLCRFFR